MTQPDAEYDGDLADDADTHEALPVPSDASPPDEDDAKVNA